MELLNSEKKECKIVKRMKIINKNGKEIELAEKEYVDDNFQYSKNLGFNNLYSKIQLKFKIKEDSDNKGCALILGSHNGEPFFQMLYFTTRTKTTIYPIVGALSISSEGIKDDGYAIRIGTAPYGTCSIYSTTPITEAIFTN